MDAAHGPFAATISSNSQRRHQSRRSQPTEIIDVDLLDDNVGRHPPPRQPSSSRRPRPVPEFIDLVGEDDDDIEVVRVNPPVRRSLFSPPPRPMERAPSVIPPVPRVPARFSAQTGFPPSARPNRTDAVTVNPPVHAGTIDIPLPRNRPSPPLPVAGPSNAAHLPIRRPSPPLAAAPRSHHVPTLGLGGALISQTVNTGRANDTGRLARVRLMPFINMLRGGFGYAFDPLDVEFDISDDDFNDRSFRLRQREPLVQQEYSSTYTHPLPVEPGFTYDFALPDSPREGAPAFPASSSSNPILLNESEDDSSPSKQSIASGPSSQSKEEDGKSKTLLVCCHCSDPLLLNAGLTASDSVNHRIWALRCGHLIDGKCLNEIGQPALVVDRKGKGKAKAEPAAFVPYGEHPSSFAATANNDDAGNASGASPGHATSIRSRLRSQTTSSSSVPAAQSAAQSGPGSNADTGVGIGRKRKRGAGKGVVNKKPKVEEEFDWCCPVEGCAKMHMSVKINGVWGPEKVRQMKRGVKASMVLGDTEKGPRGAIPVFA
ncbi:hypothetical protein FA15DRAFT_701626 [Coprinopsis marcescibilis]|uniref:Uncharacterized protein n=1 Tax=Coprinopsis marcescibilis TaxID=230819 RepID=A0A5C3L509_COPMA|nr:hypothetical protein FA15DRAFT_701626 [Coprinopsis marcescibilis]